MIPKVALKTIGRKRFKLTVYYEGPEAGDSALLDFHYVRMAHKRSEVKVEAGWEELTEGQQPER